MIENVMYLQEMLHNIQYELWEISQLDPGNFVSKLQQCPPGGGWEDQVLNMLRQAVHEYHTERAIRKYLYIGDKLVKMPGFQNIVPPYLVDIYCDVFYFLYLQKCNNELQQLKILRKFWVGSIHPFFLSKMRQNVMTRTGVDIDIFSKVQTIAKIKAHYANKLGMTEEQINKHFPPPRKSSEEKRFERKSEERFNHPYIANGSNNYQSYNLPGSNRDNFSQSITGYQSNPYQNYSNSQPSNYQMNRTLPQPYSNSINLTPSQPMPDVPSTMSMNDPRLQGEMKRKRFASQETRAVGVAAEWQPKPKKSQHKEEPLLDCHLMLERLREMNQYECRQCGLMFSSGSNLENHKDEHIKEKLRVIEGEKNQRQWEISSKMSWIGEGHGELQCQKFVIGEEGWSQEEAWCPFCCCWLGRSWVNDEWVLANASLVRLGGQLAIMHKSCQRTLQKVQKS